MQRHGNEMQNSNVSVKKWLQAINFRPSKVVLVSIWLGENMVYTVPVRWDTNYTNCWLPNQSLYIVPFHDLLPDFKLTGILMCEK